MCGCGMYSRPCASNVPLCNITGGNVSARASARSSCCMRACTWSTLLFDIESAQDNYKRVACLVCPFYPRWLLRLARAAHLASTERLDKVGPKMELVRSFTKCQPQIHYKFIFYATPLRPTLPNTTTRCPHYSMSVGRRDDVQGLGPVLAHRVQGRPLRLLHE